MAGKLKNKEDNNNSNYNDKKQQIKGDEGYLAKDPKYVPKQYHHTRVEREKVEEESPLEEDDEDNIEDNLDEKEAEVGEEDEHVKEDDSKGSPKTPEEETLEQLQKILKLEPLQNLKDLRDYKNEKERREIWKTVYEVLSGLDMDRIREMADQQQKKIDAEKKGRSRKDEL